MILLKIENNSGKYTKDGINYNSIKDITREDIKEIIEYVLFNDNIEYDNIPEDEKDNIKNPVEKIIYENILHKISDLIENKKNLISSVQKDYQELYDNYGLDSFNESSSNKY